MSRWAEQPARGPPTAQLWRRDELDVGELRKENRMPDASSKAGLCRLGAIREEKPTVKPTRRRNRTTFTRKLTTFMALPLM
jgi:hypothetical protein